MYAWTCIYGTSKILLSLWKMQCHTVDITICIRNVAIQGLYSLDLASLWCCIVSIFDSLRNNHQGSLFDLRQLLFWHFTSWGNRKLRQKWVQRTRMRLSKTSSSYSHSMSSICRDSSRSVNELSAYEYSTYGTRYEGSILASTLFDALSVLMFFIGLHLLQ